MIGADVADAAQVQAMFDRLRARWDGVDILVNNAAVTHDGFVMLMAPEAWDEVMAVNLRGAFLCARQALRPMIKRKWGRIINVVSPAALLGKDGAANYAAAKGGLLSFTKSLAREVGRYGITVNAVCPGLIDTRLIAALPAAERARHEQSIALGRFGEPAEVAHAIRFLASPAAVLRQRRDAGRRRRTDDGVIRGSNSPLSALRSPARGVPYGGRGRPPSSVHVPGGSRVSAAEAVAQRPHLAYLRTPMPTYRVDS